MLDVKDGAQVYLQKVKPTGVNSPRMVANQVICTILDKQQQCPIPAAFALRRTEYEEDTYGTTALGVGRMTVSSHLTLESHEYAFAALRLTNHDVHCVVSATLVGTRYEAVKENLLRTFARHSLSEVVRSLDRAFGETYYTAKDLVRDDRRRVLAEVSAGVLARLEEVYRQLYRENRRLLEYLRELDVPPLREFSLVAGLLLNRAFLRATSRMLQDQGDGSRLEELIAEARTWQVALDTQSAERALGADLEERLAQLLTDPLATVVPRALYLLDFADRLGFNLDLWRAQTLFARVCRRHLRSLFTRGVHEAGVAHQLALLRRLGERLGFYAVEGTPLETWDRESKSPEKGGCKDLG
jgi:hypothetical protein